MFDVAVRSAAFVGVWTVMMLGMMAPSMVPTVLLFARTARPANPSSRAGPSVIFVTGYLAAWAGVGLLIGFARDIGTPMREAWGRQLSAAGLIGAGVYQLTSWKARCLTH